MTTYTNKDITALLSEMMDCRDESQVDGLMYFFKTGPGEYGEDDRFLGIRMPTTQAIQRQLWRKASMQDLEACITSPWLEVQLAALLTLLQIKHARKHMEVLRNCINFYLAHTNSFNNWNLVDLSYCELLGTWLLDKERASFYNLARHGHLWEQRIAIVTTMQFLRHDETQDTSAIAYIQLQHPHDLQQKAVGWPLREADKHNEKELITFLDKHHQEMPRTMLR